MNPPPRIPRLDNSTHLKNRRPQNGTGPATRKKNHPCHNRYHPHKKEQHDPSEQHRHNQQNQTNPHHPQPRNSRARRERATGQDAGPPGRVPAVFGPQRPADARPGVQGDAGRRLPQMAGDGLLSVAERLRHLPDGPYRGVRPPPDDGAEDRGDVVPMAHRPLDSPWIGARLAVVVEGRAARLKV